MEFGNGKQHDFIRVLAINAALSLRNFRSKSFCYDTSREFDGLDDTTLTGKRTLGTPIAAFVLILFGSSYWKSIVAPPKQKARLVCREKSLGFRDCFHC